MDSQERIGQSEPRLIMEVGYAILPDARSFKSSEGGIPFAGTVLQLSGRLVDILEPQIDHM